MSAEQKKLLWLSVSVCAVILVLAAAGFFLFAPKQGKASAPATVGNTAAPKSADPQDFLMTPPPAPSFEQPRSAAGDVVVVYGEKPTSLDGAPSSAGTTPPNASALPPATGVSTPTASVVASKANTQSSKKMSSPNAAASLPPVGAKTKPKGTAAKVQSPQKVQTDEYWIQAASFTSRGRADELKDLLAAKGIASLISVKDIDGKSWYRVRIGPYSGKNEAEGWLLKLKDLPGCSEAYISKASVEHNG
jgi:DedD protein